MVHACVLSMELHIQAARSLKAKRSVIRHLVESSRSRFGVAAAEAGYHDEWQRSLLGFAAVAGSEGHVAHVLDGVERFVWSHPDIEVVAGDRRWLEADG